MELFVPTIYPVVIIRHRHEHRPVYQATWCDVLEESTLQQIALFVGHLTSMNHVKSYVALNLTREWIANDVKVRNRGLFQGISSAWEEWEKVRKLWVKSVPDVALDGMTRQVTLSLHGEQPAEQEWTWGCRPENSNEISSSKSDIRRWGIHTVYVEPESKWPHFET